MTDDALIDLVRAIAGSIARRLHRWEDFADLVQEGFAGALAAKARHDPSKASFRTFAGHRAAGAMRDWLRAERAVHSGVPRANCRRHARRVDVQELARLPIPAKVQSPEAHAIAAEGWRSVMTRATARQRQVLRLARRGYSQGEIARRLGIHQVRVSEIERRLLKAAA